jgi:hypothetical protein
MDFDDAIRQHRELQRRNAGLEPTMPLERYRAQMPSREGVPFDPQPEAADEETRDLSFASSADSHGDGTAGASLLWDVAPLFGSDD